MDVIVRGEGEQTFRELLRAHGSGAPGSTRLAAFRTGTATGFVRNADRPIAGLARIRCGCPTAAPACSSGYTLLGRQVDVVETSRGCTFDCSFCSIIEMRGHNFHTIRSSGCWRTSRTRRRHGARAIFLVDDNITLDVRRFEALCQAIIDGGFNDTEYFVQAMTSPLAQHGASLAPLMQRAGCATCSSASRTCSTRISAFLESAARRTRAASTAGHRQRDHRGNRRISIATGCSSSAG